MCSGCVICQKGNSIYLTAAKYQDTANRWFTTFTQCLFSLKKNVHIVVHRGVCSYRDFNIPRTTCISFLTALCILLVSCSCQSFGVIEKNHYLYLPGNVDSPQMDEIKCFNTLILHVIVFSQCITMLLYFSPALKQYKGTFFLFFLMWVLQVAFQKIENIQPKRPDFFPSFSFGIFNLMDDCKVQKFAICTNISYVRRNGNGTGRICKTLFQSILNCILSGESKWQEYCVPVVSPNSFVGFIFFSLKHLLLILQE